MTNTEILRPLSRPQAELELDILQIEADDIQPGDLYATLREMGLPPEIAIRLEALIDTTRKIGGRTINIGKIIVLKLIEFVKQHRNLAIGVAIGAAVSTLVGAIPLLGPLLAPVALVLGISVGAIAGHRLDKGIRSDDGIISITQDVIEIAKAFFALLISIFNAVSDELSAQGEHDA